MMGIWKSGIAGLEAATGKGLSDLSRLLRYKIVSYDWPFRPEEEYSSVRASGGH